MTCSTPLSPAVGAGPQRRPAWLLVAGVLLAAANLRTAVTSVGPLLDELSRGVGLSSGVAGVLTTLPVVSFAVLGSLAPRLARRFGEERALAVALLLMTAGLLARVLTSSAVPFLLLSVVALAGGALGNVLLPGVVKRDFPSRIGPMTAAYTTALAVGTTASAALTVPFASLHGSVDWRLGLGVWTVPAALGACLWLVLGARGGRGGRGGRTGATVAARRPLPVARSRTAWALALFFGAQSMQAYVAFGWFALFFQEQAGSSAAQAGLLVAVLPAVGIPVSLLVPSVAARMPDQRPLLLGLLACYLLSYGGMLTAPRAGAVLWMVLAGIGGGAFPLSLTLIGLRSRTAEGATALSAFSQSLGYALAAGGPLLVGVLHGATDGWTWPFVVVFADLALLAVSGWYILRPRYVEDDLAAR